MGVDPSGALLLARDVACSRGGQPVCELARLGLMPGRGAWLRGRNGCGKTSLLRVLSGLCLPERGSIERLAGVRGFFLGHANALKEDLTVVENLRFLAALNDLHASDDALAAALRGWGLWSRRHACLRTLSQGLKRRVALARLDLAADHALWLLDEPFDALDDGVVSLLYQRLAGHQAAGGALVITSHTPLREGVLALDEIWLDGGGAS